MANTKIPVELSSTPGIADSSDATAITINSSEQVGIGTTSPVATLQVKTQTNGNLAFQNSTSVSGGVKLNCFNDAANASSPFEIDGSTLQFNVAASEKMRIDSSGRAMIGTTDAGYPDYGDSLTLGDVDGGGGNAGMTIRSGSGSYGTFYFSDDTGTAAGTYAGKMQYNHSNNSLIFATNSVDRFTIDSSGNAVFSGATITVGDSHTFGNGGGDNLHIESSSGENIVINSAGGIHVFQDNGTEQMRISGDNVLIKTTDTGQNSGTGVKFVNTRLYMVNGLTSGEQISYYGSGGYKYYVSVAGKIHTAVGPAVYSVSDERLKENIRDYDKGLTDILKLKPRLFDWKEGEGSNEKNVSGFVAQECEAAGFDEFVGDFKHDTLTDAKSFGAGGLIPALVKAIQEQQTIIDDLKSRIEKLEE